MILVVERLQIFSVAPGASNRRFLGGRHVVFNFSCCFHVVVVFMLFSIFKTKALNNMALNNKVRKVNELLETELALNGLDMIDNSNIMFNSIQFNSILFVKYKVFTMYDKSMKKYLHSTRPK